MHTNIRFKGVIPPMITPFSSDGAVDYPALERNIAQWNQAGLGGYLVLGSNSEAASLSETEKLELVARSAAAMQPQHVLLAGTGMESTRETIRLSNLAAREGAQAALVLTPFYYKDSLSDEAQIRHFQEVADNVHIPVLIYNVPKYTNINVSNRVIEVLSQHPNIIGMKDSSGNIAQLVEFQRVADPRFQILTGTAGVWYPALVLGVQAGIMALANCAPAELVEVQSLFETGHPAEAEALYRKWVPVNHAVTATYGVAGLKHACTLRGYAAGAVRSPLPPLSDKGKEAIAHLLAGC